MPSGDDTGPSESTPPSRSPSDDFLVESLIAGDAAALRTLMQRYDRLVRYAIFRMSRDRCARDPQWLDSVAGETWAGLVQALRRGRDSRPASLKAYLTQIARNRCVSALRQGKAGQPLSLDNEELAGNIETDGDGPAELLGHLEDLDALRACLAQLGPDDRALTAQLSAIVDRKWRVAADALGLAESTLRSRWKVTLNRLRLCLESKTDNTFAPTQPASDS